MADIDVVRKPAGQTTWLWALLAIVTVIGLMAWLAVQSSRTTTATIVQESENGGRQAAADPVDMTELAAIGDSPDAFIGQQVTTDAPVAATVGPRAFWADIPGANPVLVVLTPAVDAPALASGSRLRVSGRVVEVSEQLVDTWIAEGAVNAGSRDEATFATHAIMADAVTPR